MKIGVVSDTHSIELPEQLIEDFKNVDMIIHAGDFCSLKEYKDLAKITEVKGVYGNMDDSEIRKKFPRRQIIKIDNFFIGLFHGEGPPQTILKSVKTEFKGDDLDVVIFGHSHEPLKLMEGKTLYFNPGSPNDTVYAPYCSYGLLNLEHGQIIAKNVKVKNG